jgi:trigger factor
MRVSVETTSGLERRLTVGVPADRVDGCREAASGRGEQRQAPGFRPGKVPMK